MPLLALIVFVVVPIAELYVIIQVAHVIGGWSTIALLIIESLIGTWLVRREGRRAWQSLQASLRSYRAPTAQIADGALIIVGGALLLTPGFLTDIAGFFFLVPFTRPLARRFLLRMVGRRAFGRAAKASSRRGGSSVIEGEAVKPRNDETPPNR